MKIINNQDRKKLNEGRNFQMGFAFLKKIKPNTFETVQPISPCKDYLNDVVYSETTGNKITAYGLTYEKQNIFTKKCYITIAIVPENHRYSKADVDRDIKNLDKNYELLQKMLNSVEDLLNFEHTTIHKVESNSFILEFSKSWVQSTYLISLYSLLCRVFQFATKEEDPITFLKTFKAFAPDIFLINSALIRLEYMIKNGPVPQDFALLLPNTSTHNCGICALQIPQQ